MSRARQGRRIARDWARRLHAEAWKLGLAAGDEEGEIFAQELRMPSGEHFDSEGRLEALEEALRPELESWDSGAREAHAHKVDGCPNGHEEAYYEAYDRGARSRIKKEIKKLKAELEAEGRVHSLCSDLRWDVAPTNLLLVAL